MRQVCIFSRFGNRCVRRGMRWWRSVGCSGSVRVVRKPGCGLDEDCQFDSGRRVCIRLFCNGRHGRMWLLRYRRVRVHWTMRMSRGKRSKRMGRNHRSSRDSRMMQRRRGSCKGRKSGRDRSLRCGGMRRRFGGLRLRCRRGLCRCAHSRLGARLLGCRL